MNQKLAQTMNKMITQMKIDEINSFRSKTKVIEKHYGLLDFEVILLYHLNDTWFFTFDEFCDILRRAPKMYSSTITRQRLVDSVVWHDYILTFRTSDGWDKFMSERKTSVCQSAFEWREKISDDLSIE